MSSLMSRFGPCQNTIIIKMQGKLIVTCKKCHICSISNLNDKTVNVFLFHSYIFFLIKSNTSPTFKHREYSSLEMKVLLDARELLQNTNTK